MCRAARLTLTCLFLSACGGGDSGPSTDTTEADTTEVDTAATDTSSEVDTTAVDTTPVGPATTCDGPAAIYVETEAGDAPEVIAYGNGDLSIRGYASSCGEGGDVDSFTLRGCLGSLAATLDWTVGASTLEAQISVPALQDGPLLDSAGEVAGHTLSAELTTPESGELDVQITVRCSAGEPTAWSLLLDTASEVPVPVAENGWPVDLYPRDYPACDGTRFPRIEDALDEYGATDVSMGQFLGDMTLVEIGAVWCYGCTLFARDSDALHEEVEAMSPDWGFSIVELLIEDFQYTAAGTNDAAEWAVAYGVSEAVLAGPTVSAVYHDDCTPKGAWPTFVVVDPLGQIRGTTAGYDGRAELKSLVAQGWSAFIAEHPSWVSPRCAGVAGERTLCPCADPTPGEGEQDADHDGVRDACDTCPSGNDRLDLDRDGVADACDETPGYEGPEPVVITQITIRATFGFDGDETIQGWDVTGTPESSFVRVTIKTESSGNCYFTRIIDGPTTLQIPEAYQTSGEAGGPPRILAGWDFSVGSSINGAACDDRLDLPLRGEAFVEELLSINWGFVVLDSCGAAGCARRDDILWELWGCAEDPNAVYCKSALGAAVWFGDSGLVLSAEGETAGYVTAQEYESESSLEYDSLSFELLPLPALQPTLPRGVYSFEVRMFPDEFYQRFLPNLTPPQR